MKPSELEIFNALPDAVHAYRAHRSGETDFISFTLSLDFAMHLLDHPDSDYDFVVHYEIPRSNIIAFFNRRGEGEIIVLDLADVYVVPINN